MSILAENPLDFSTPRQGLSATVSSKISGTSSAGTIKKIESSNMYTADSYLHTILEVHTQHKAGQEE